MVLWTFVMWFFSGIMLGFNLNRLGRTGKNWLSVLLWTVLTSINFGLFVTFARLTYGT